IGSPVDREEFIAPNQQGFTGATILDLHIADAEVCATEAGAIGLEEHIEGVAGKAAIAGYAQLSEFIGEFVGGCALYLLGGGSRWPVDQGDTGEHRDTDD